MLPEDPMGRMKDRGFTRRSLYGGPLKKLYNFFPWNLLTRYLVREVPECAKVLEAPSKSQK